MRKTKDIVIIIAFVSLVVSSTAAWAINDQGSYTSNFVQIMDAPMKIVDKTSDVSSGNFVVDIDIRNQDTSPLTATVMIQLVDHDGDPMYVDVNGTDPSRAIMGEAEAESVTWNAGQKKSVDFEVNLQGRGSELGGYTIYIEDDSSDYATRYEKTETGEKRDVSEGMAVYREDDTTSPYKQRPKARQFLADWQAEVKLPWTVKTAEGTSNTIRADATTDTSKTEFLAAVFRGDGKPSFFDFVDDTWTKTDLGVVIGNASENIKPFDIEYESNSAHGLIVYADTTAGQIKGKMFMNEAWYTAPTLTMGSSQIKYIKMAADPDPSSDEIAIVAVAEDLKAYAAIWNGNSWADVEELTGLDGWWVSQSATDYEYEVADIAYRYDNGLPIVVVAAGDHLIMQDYDGTRTSGDRWDFHDQWRGEYYGYGNWYSNGPDGVKLHTNKGGEIRWVVLNSERKTSSNQLGLITLDTNTNITVPNGVYLSGYLEESSTYSWVEAKELARTMESSDTRTIDGDWAPDGTQFWVFGAQKDNASLSYKLFDVDFGTFDEATTSVDEWFGYDMGGNDGDIQWVQATPTPFLGEPNFFIATISDVNELRFTNIETTTDPTDQSGFSDMRASNNVNSHAQEGVAIAVRKE